MSKASHECDALEQKLENLALVLERHDLTHLEYEDDDTHIVLKKEGSAQTSLSPLAPQVLANASPLQNTLDTQNATAKSLAGELQGTSSPQQPRNPAYTPHQTEERHASDSSQPSALIAAPLVGLAYRSKDPDAEPFVSVGDHVEEGTVLCLIEAMKMFNEVKAPCAGTISAVHFADGELVEFGAPLFSLH